MRVLRILSVALVCALVAGCVGDDAPAGTDDTLDTSLVREPDAAGPAPVPLGEAPVWRAGDAWLVTSSFGGVDRQWTIVVTSATSETYTTAVTDEETAGFDAIFDVSYVGKIRARDLAGHQRDEPIQYFDFPLAEGKSWTTMWDEREVVLTATKGARGFDIVGTVDGEPYVAYDYVPELKWWSRLDFIQDEFGLRFGSLQEGWQGEILQASAQLIHESAQIAPVAAHGTGSFVVSEGQTFVLLMVSGGGERWARNFWLIDPTGAPWLDPGISNVEAEAMGPTPYFGQMRLPPTPGEWRVAFDAVHDPSGAYSLTVHEVAVTAQAFP